MGHCCLGMKKGQFRHVIAEESRLACTWPPSRLQKPSSSPSAHLLTSKPGGPLATEMDLSDLENEGEWGEERRIDVFPLLRTCPSALHSCGRGVIPSVFKAGVWSRESCRSEGPYERQTITNLFVHPCKTALAFHPPAPISAGHDFPQTSIMVTYAVWSRGFSLT